MSAKQISVILFLACLLVGVTSCEKNSPDCAECKERLAFYDAYLYYNQPIPTLYEQMLLKGNVRSVITYETLELQVPYVRTVEHKEEIKFEDSGHTKYYAYDDVEYGVKTDLEVIGYWAYYSSFPNLEFWRLTWLTYSYSTSYVDAKTGKTIRREYQIDEDGRYTRYRAYVDDMPVQISLSWRFTTPSAHPSMEGDIEIEKYLYDENGFPLYSFGLDESYNFSPISKFAFTDLDEKGNPLSIHIQTQGGSHIIRREITYRD